MKQGSDPMKATLELRDAGTPNEALRGRVALLWTDPPYGTGKAQTQGVSYQDRLDTDYVFDALVAWLPFMAEDGTICVCCDYRLAPRIAEALPVDDWEYRGELIWEFGLGSGTVGVAACTTGRRFYGSDTNLDAMTAASRRLAEWL